MAVLKASRLKAVLDKARNAGQVEETATIAGLELVFSSLHSEAYNAILAELSEVPETAYALCYQMEHVCRSIVEIDGQSLRDIDYVESDVEGATGAVKVERHAWVRDIVSTWSREMLQIAFRKVLDAIAGAEAKATHGVQFRLESETDEEKYRRLLTEAKETAGDVPEDMKAAILKEYGLVEITSQQDLESLGARARTWAEEASPAAGVEAAPPAPTGPPRAPVQIVEAAASDPSEAATEGPEELMARRTPLNRTAIHEPTPQVQADSVPGVANRRSPPPPPDQVHKISSRYESTEGWTPDIDSDEQYAAADPGDTPVVLEHRRTPVNDGLKTILDQPPTVGRNVKYSPRAGGGLNPRSRG